MREIPSPLLTDVIHTPGMAWRWTLWVVVACGVAAGLILWAGGERTFVTHPVSVLALAAAAVAVAHLGRASMDDVFEQLSLLAGSIAAYLMLGAWASAAPDSLSAGLWSAGWIPINALLATTGLAAAGFRRSARALLALSAALVVAGAWLVRPVAPFQGIATAAPQGWERSAPLLVDGLLAVWNLALIIATAAVFTQARRASLIDRRRLARAAAVTSCAPCLVLTCYALAVLRDPGDVSPQTGSVAYLCAIAGLAVVSAWAAVTDSSAAIRVIAGVWAASVLVVGGVALAGPVAEQNLTLGVLAIVASTAVVMVVAVSGLLRFERWSQLPPPRVITQVLPGLSPRENDVLAAVARGGTNAAVAAELFLSERTVEQHLRTVFAKLELGDHGGSNRRVRAAALWWERQQT